MSIPIPKIQTKGILLAKMGVKIHKTRTTDEFIAVFIISCGMALRLDYSVQALAV
jgi:hypothetical protein